MQRHFSTCKYSKKLIYNICGFAGFYFLSNPHFIRKIIYLIKNELTLIIFSSILHYTRYCHNLCEEHKHP